MFGIDHLGLKMKGKILGGQKHPILFLRTKTKT